MIDACTDHVKRGSMVKFEERTLYYRECCLFNL